jgi:hypothetical protein
MLRYTAIAFAIIYQIAGLNLASAQEVTPLIDKHDKGVKARHAIGSTDKDSNTLEPTQSKIKPCASKHPPKWCDETKM